MIFFRKLHKWIGLVIGIQVAIWMLSGFMMGLLDHEQVTGLHNQTEKHASARLSQGRELVEPAEILSQFSDGAVIRRIRLLTLLDSPMYRAELALGPQLFDAISGRKFEITDVVARRIAENDYAGSGQISDVTSVMAPTMEVRRHTGDVWRVDFNDEDATSLYVSKALS